MGMGQNFATPMSLPQFGRLLWLCLQLGLVLLVIYPFQLESRRFFNVMALGFTGFVVHALPIGQHAAALQLRPTARTEN